VKTKTDAVTGKTEKTHFCRLFEPGVQTSKLF